MSSEFPKTVNKFNFPPMVLASELLDVVSRGYSRMTKDTDFTARVVVYGTKVGGYVRIVPSEKGLKWLKHNRREDYWPTTDEPVRFCNPMITWRAYCNRELNSGCNIPYQVYCRSHVGPVYVEFAVPHLIIKGM